MTLNISGTAEDSIVDGPGLRLAVFAQGCPHRCEGCHNPATWPFDAGRQERTEALAQRALKNPLCAGVTLSGGEPFAQPEAMADLARRVREGGKSVWIYTGYTLEELERGENPSWAALLGQADILVDGAFVLAQRSLELRFRGSRNQRIFRRGEDGIFRDATGEWE